MELKHNTELVGATWVRPYGNQPLDWYDEGIGPLWVCGNESGPTRIIRALSFDVAWEIMVDGMATIEPAELPEAYGFDSQAELDAAVESGEWPDLIEGYEFQSNASGTGIVDVGHYAWLRELTLEDRGGEYRISVRGCE